MDEDDMTTAKLVVPTSMVSFLVESLVDANHGDVEVSFDKYDHKDSRSCCMSGTRFFREEVFISKQVRVWI